MKACLICNCSTNNQFYSTSNLLWMPTSHPTSIKQKCLIIQKPTTPQANSVIGVAHINSRSCDDLTQCLPLCVLLLWRWCMADSAICLHLALIPTPPPLFWSHCFYLSVCLSVWLPLIVSVSRCVSLVVSLSLIMIVFASLAVCVLLCVPNHDQYCHWLCVSSCAASFLGCALLCTARIHLHQSSDQQFCSNLARARRADISSNNLSVASVAPALALHSPSLPPLKPFSFLFFSYRSNIY